MLSARASPCRCVERYVGVVAAYARVLMKSEVMGTVKITVMGLDPNYLARDVTVRAKAHL